MINLQLVTQQFQSVIQALQQGLDDNLVALVLFGSRARGDARPESDWDLLLIAHNLPSPFFARHLFLKNNLPPDWRGRISLLAKTVAEFERAVPSLFLDIALDGIIIYEQGDYARQHLRYLKELIQTKGLHRRQQGRDLIWEWQNFPGLNWQLTWQEQI